MAFDRHRPPYKLAGAVLLAIVVLFGFLLAKQYRGDFVKQTELRVLAGRAGLVVDPGSKVTLNGVEIGRVAHIDTADEGWLRPGTITQLCSC
jgi:phospholipid/cholesterol/gamma-HCH transport system substrate-binding protein